MIRLAVKGFLVGYFLAVWVGIATGWFDWRPLMDLVVGAILGYLQSSGIEQAKAIFRQSSRFKHRSSL